MMNSIEIFEHINHKIRNILKKGLNGEEINNKEALELLKTTGKEFLALQSVANEICFEKKKDLVTFVVNRNINFTNVCYQKCKFCSFSVPQNHSEAFLLTINEIEKKILESNKFDITEVCIQGGINPELTFDYYLDILRKVKELNSEIHIHAFSPQEVYYMAKLFDKSIKETLLELKKAGLGSIPGTAAEILVDKVRKIICPNKISTKEWIEIISSAHSLGIPTTSTMMYGHIEDLEDRVEHLSILREIQKKTKGFTEFVALPFIKEKPILSKLPEISLKPSYGMADLKLFSVARIYLNNLIDNIQCSWVKLGPKLAQISLNYGVNDFSGTLLEENISKSAGADFGEYLSPDEIISVIRDAGKIPAQRGTLYNIIQRF